MSRTTRLMLTTAAWCVIAFAVLLVLAYYVGPTAWLDSAALRGFSSFGPLWLSDLARYIANLCNPLPYSVAAAVVIAAAVKTRGLRVAAAAGLLLFGANVSSQVLKPVLAHHRELYYTQFHLNNIDDAALPSGHATAAMALSVAALIVVPRAYRPLMAVGGVLFTLAVSFSILILQWHWPSDVVAGYLIATAWGLTAFAALRYSYERWPERGTIRVAARNAVPAPTPATIAKVALALTALCTLAAASRADQIAGFAERHTAMVAVASAIVVAAAVLLAAVASISSSRRSG